MPRPSRLESRQQTRQRLLDAAGTAFTRAGYAGTSVDKVAEAAGFSKGAVYSNFDSKEAIFLELLEQHMSDEVTASGEYLVPGASAGDAIDRIASRYATDPGDQQWCLLSIEFALHARRSPAFAARRAALYARHYDAIAALITAIAARADTRVADPVAAAAIFVALRQGLALERSQPDPALAEAAVRSSLRAWMRALVQLD